MEDNNKYANDDISDEEECKILVTRESNVKHIPSLLANVVLHKMEYQ